VTSASDSISTAGAQAGEVVARHVSAMQPERESVLQDLRHGTLQVWQSLSEAAGGGVRDPPLPGAAKADQVLSQMGCLTGSHRVRSPSCAPGERSASGPTARPAGPRLVSISRGE
jgi:hypothetical protein